MGNDTPIPSILNITMPQNSKKPIPSFQPGTVDNGGADLYPYTMVATTQATEI